MVIRLLNISIEINITNERIFNYLTHKLSHFYYWAPEVFITITEVSEETIGTNYDVFGNSKIFYNKEKNDLSFFYSEKDESLYLELVILVYIFLILMKYKTFYLHGSCLTINQDKNNGLLILGKSGSGKTSLALKMIDAGEHIVSDDFLLLQKKNKRYIAYLNRTKPHVFYDNLNQNFNEYLDYVKEKQTSDNKKIEINIDEKCMNVYEKYIVPKYIVIISDSFYTESIVEKTCFNRIVTYIIEGSGLLPNYSYRNYFEFAFDICQQCSLFYLKKKQGIENNIKPIYEAIKIQCNIIKED